MNKNKYNEFNQRLYYKSDFLQESPHTKTGVRCDHITNYDAQWDDELPEISPSVVTAHSPVSPDSRQLTACWSWEWHTMTSQPGLVMPDTCSDTTSYLQNTDYGMHIGCSICMQNKGCRIQNTADTEQWYRMQNNDTGYRTQNIEYWMQDTECRIRDAGLELLEMIKWLWKSRRRQY